MDIGLGISIPKIENAEIVGKLSVPSARFSSNYSSVVVNFDRSSSRGDWMTMYASRASSPYTLGDDWQVSSQPSEFLNEVREIRYAHRIHKGKPMTEFVTKADIDGIILVVQIVVVGSHTSIPESHRQYLSEIRATILKEGFQRKSTGANEVTEAID